MNQPAGQFSFDLGSRFQNFSLRRGGLFGIIILGALLAFEIFNYSTTDFALRDLLGDMRFAGLRWATILSLAFCGIDFAGIARLFTPDQNGSEPTEVWYLFGAWLLAATMNAILTWWGVSMAIVNHQMQSATVLDPGLLMKAVPVFVAVMVWLIRILIIGSLSYAGERMFTVIEQRPVLSTAAARPRPLASSSGYSQRSSLPAAAAPATPIAPRPARPAPKPMVQPELGVTASHRPEHTYPTAAPQPRVPAMRANASERYPSRETRR